jgi:hypothetical protein
LMLFGEKKKKTARGEERGGVNDVCGESTERQSATECCAVTRSGWWRCGIVKREQNTGT